MPCTPRATLCTKVYAQFSASRCVHNYHYSTERQTIHRNFALALVQHFWGFSGSFWAKGLPVLSFLLHRNASAPVVVKNQSPTCARLIFIQCVSTICCLEASNLRNGYISVHYRNRFQINLELLAQAFHYITCFSDASILSTTWLSGPGFTLHQLFSVSVPSQTPPIPGRIRIAHE